MDCDRCERLIQLYVDREINSMELKFLRKHVKHCKSCTTEWKEMISLVRSLDQIGLQQKTKFTIDLSSFLVAFAFTIVILYML